MSDEIDHIAINVADIAAAVAWYKTSFSCEVESESATAAVLRFANVRLSLVLPNREQPHVAVEKSDASTYGELRDRADGRRSTYVSDPTGNLVELLEPRK